MRGENYIREAIELLEDYRAELGESEKYLATGEEREARQVRLSEIAGVTEGLAALVGSWTTGEEKRRLYVRMLYGAYDNQEGPHDFYLAPVAFPMEVEADAEMAPTGRGTMLVGNEEELANWAGARFCYYEVWNMAVPEGAFLDEGEAEESTQGPPCPECGHPLDLLGEDCKEAEKKMGVEDYFGDGSHYAPIGAHHTGVSCPQCGYAEAEPCIHD